MHQEARRILPSHERWSPAAGKPAPDFCLPGADGQFYALSDVRGPNGLLIILLSNRCPFVAAVLPRLNRDVAELHRYGVGAVGVNVNATRAHVDESFDAMGRFAREHRLPFPYLFDGEQTVARALGATHTPDFFGFDRNLELRYHGRLDASREDSAPDDARRELFAAMRQIALFGSAPRLQLSGAGSPIRWAASPPSRPRLETARAL
jgi:peroxiredoxin